MAKIDTYSHFQGLTLLKLSNLQQGDILIKKVFPGLEKGAVEEIITKGQGLFDSAEKIKIDNGWLKKSETVKFENFGSPTAEHAAIVVNINGSNQLAESVEGGVKRSKIGHVSHERYVVWRCVPSERLLASYAADIAIRMTNLGTVDKVEFRGGDGGYSLSGAVKSNMKSPYFQQDTFKNRIVTTATESYLQRIIDYCYNNRGTRPNVFCSEFIMACYEAGSYFHLKKTAFGSNPVAMSPLQMENILHYSEKVAIVGRVESIDDILFYAVKEGINDYKKSLTGWKSRLGLRRPSKNSLDALGVLEGLVATMSASDAFFPVMEHYLDVKAIHILKMPFKLTARGVERGEMFYDALPVQLTAPLEKGSTFSETLKKHIRGTGLFLVD